jgi:hypothetical protein
MVAPRDQDLTLEKGAREMARGHMGQHVTKNRGARLEKGAAAQYFIKSGFYITDLVFFNLIMPIFNRFLPFWGDIGHFWRPDSWRKLGM